MTKKPTHAKRRQGKQAKAHAAELALAQQAEELAKAEAEQKAAEARKRNARHAIHPVSNAATVVEAYGERIWGKLDIQAVSDGLVEKCKSVHKGDLHHAESILISQAKALDAVFSVLARRAINQEHLNQFDLNLRLALKAQNQCRMTLETLATIKNPPVVFAKQANIAHGPQQVNNGTAIAHAGETEKPPTELLEHDHGERLDTGTAAAAGRSDPAVATVVEIHRTAQRGRQGRIKP